MANLLKKVLASLDKALNTPIETGGLKNILQSLNLLSKKSTEERKIENDAIILQKHNEITWIDIKNPTKKELSEFFKDYPFHPLHIEACLSRGQLDRIEPEEKYLFVLIHNPSYQESQARIVAKKVCLFIGKNYVITVHENSAVVRDLFQLCQENEKEREEFFKKSPVFLSYSILNALFKDTAQYRKEILEELEGIEDLVFDIKVSGVFEISQLRQKIVRLKRITSSFRKVLQELSLDSSPYTVGMTRYYKSLANEANNLWDTLEEASETIEIYKDADVTVSTEKTNNILSLLTIVFTLTIPTTILGTFFGMNILLPGGIEAGSWDFLGPYTTLIVVCGISITSIIAMLWYFKYRDWF